jgi:hypothetical protein
MTSGGYKDRRIRIHHQNLVPVEVVGDKHPIEWITFRHVSLSIVSKQ